MVILVGAGVVALVVWRMREHGTTSGSGSGLGVLLLPVLPALHQLGQLGPVVATAGPVMLAPLFLVFLQIGAVLCGSGYVLYALLEAQLVSNHHWLTERQLLDAITMGQLTPGPLFPTATFIGYTLRGFPGAVVATVGIFLPAFVFVAATDAVGAAAPRQRRVRRVPDGRGRGVPRTDGRSGRDPGVGRVRRRVDRRRGDRGRSGAAVAPVNPVWLILAGALAGAVLPGLG